MSAASDGSPTGEVPVATRSRGARLARRAAANTGILAGGAILVAMALIAIFAPLITLSDPYAQDLTQRFLPPFWMERSVPEHWLGTDHLGRDYFARMVYGARVSLGVGLGVALVTGIIGVTLGLFAGFFGGVVDMVISFLITTRLSLPIVLVALAAVALVGASLGTLVVVLGLLLWDRFAVVTRSATQSLASREFVTGARAVGRRPLGLIFGEILPNLKGAVIVVATLEVANAILLEAALSFLGLGVRPPMPSWGLMIAEGRENILFDPWLIALPGGAICVLVLGVNLLGDGLRDISGPVTR